MKFIKKLLLSLFSGLILSAAWPVDGIPFLIFFGFVPLFMIEKELTDNATSPKYLAVLGYSYLSFLIWNLLTTYWVYNSTPEGSFFAFTLNSLFMAGVFMLFSMTKQKLGARKGYAALPIYWVAFEYLHFDWDLSWPWLTLGNVFASYPQTVQWYELTGILGGTVWVLVVNISIFLAFQKFSESTNLPNKIKPLVNPVALIVIPLILSFYLYFSYSETASETVDVVVVQPNVDPYHEKFDTSLYGDNVFKMINLANEEVDENTDFVFFPETALPEGVLENKIDSNPNLNILKTWLRSYPKLNLITGLNYYRFFDTRAGDVIPSTATQLRGSNTIFYDDYNAAIQLDSTTRRQLYFKSKLVPGPEMFPFAEYLKPIQDLWFKDLGGMVGDLGTQDERSVFVASDKSHKVGIIICYESIYGEFTGAYVKNGAQFLSIITNDGWWGDTPGHRQHFEYARLRAIETRRWVARAANTGISGFIDTRGNVVAKSKYWETDVMKHSIPVLKQMTFYVKYGDYLGRLAVFVAVFLLFYAFVTGFLKKRK